MLVAVSGADLAEEQQPLLQASATEWVASASIEEIPERRKAMNMVIAIPVLSIHAAATALVPPSAVRRRPDGRASAGG